jgi:hypothetical protein
MYQGRSRRLWTRRRREHGEPIATSNGKEFFDGTVNFALLALSLVPCVDEGAAVADVTMNAGKDLAGGEMVESGTDSVMGDKPPATLDSIAGLSISHLDME